jgi:8-oxo-dGTP pyrophosphatase MutT (NUDIX family)
MIGTPGARDEAPGVPLPALYASAMALPPEPAPAPIPAATVVVIRDGRQGLEALMLRRNSALAFGGMWVFPGGRVEAGDFVPGAPDDERLAARRAAVREAREEAGLDVDETTLVPFSHWVPPPQAPKRFSTWFFLAEISPDLDVVIDGGEIHEHQWLHPAEALRRRDLLEIELAPPTWVTLRRLSSAADAAAALAEAAAAGEPERFVTNIVRSGHDLVALWHGDAGYEDGQADRPGGRHRLWMLADGWRYERS